MTEMQFYKKRDFATLLGDTLDFFKKFGKNFFKNYLMVNGILMIIITVLLVLFYKNIFGQIMGGNMQGETYLFEEFFQENPVLLIISGVALFLLLLATMLVNYSFPVLYIRRLAQMEDRNIRPDQMLEDIKRIIPKFLIFLLGSIFILAPISFLLMAAGTVLIFVIIGFFLLLLLFPLLLNVINFTLFDSYNTNRGFFGSLSYAVRAQFSYPDSRDGSPFWKYWASTVLIFFIYYILTTVITVIPMAIVMSSIFTLPPEELAKGSAFQEAFGISFFVIYGISILVSMVLANLIFVCSALQYYDSRTDLHRKIDFQDIDMIGTGEV